MTDEQIQKDFKDRSALAMADIQAILDKYEVELDASGKLGDLLVVMPVRFMDKKKHSILEMAQPTILTPYGKG